MTTKQAKPAPNTTVPLVPNVKRARLFGWFGTRQERKLLAPRKETDEHKDKLEPTLSQSQTAEVVADSSESSPPTNGIEADLADEPQLVDEPIIIDEPKNREPEMLHRMEELRDERDAALAVRPRASRGRTRRWWQETAHQRALIDELRRIASNAEREAVVLCVLCFAIVDVRAPGESALQTPTRKSKTCAGASRKSLPHPLRI